MMISRRGRGGQVRRKGKSKRWRAKMRQRAEAKAAERKRARDAKKCQREVAGRDAATRFEERQQLFRDHYGQLGGFVHALAWLTHNCVAHPVLGLLPCALTVWIHDRSADWLNLSPIASDSELPVIPDRRAWLVHNCIAHPRMGLAPLRRAFDAHEHTAERMQVEGWV